MNDSRTTVGKPETIEDPSKYGAPWHVFTLDAEPKKNELGDDLGYFYGGYLDRYSAVLLQQKFEYDDGLPCWVVRSAT